MAGSIFPTTRERATLNRGSALEFVLHTPMQEFDYVHIHVFSPVHKNASQS